MSKNDDVVRIGPWVAEVVSNLHATAKNDAVFAPTQTSHGATKMSELTREEVDARLSATEARVDKAMAEIRSDVSIMKHDVLTAVSTLKGDLTKELAKVQMDFAKEQLASSRYRLTTVLTILLAVAAGTIATINANRIFAARTALTPGASPQLDVPDSSKELSPPTKR